MTITNPLPKTILEKFITLCRRERTIDFPNVARQLGIDFTTSLLPHIKEDEWLKGELKKFVIELRYEAANRLFQKDPSKREVAKILEGGFLWGEEEKEPDATEEQKEEPETSAEDRRRLGLPEQPEE